MAPEVVLGIKISKFITGTPLTNYPRMIVTYFILNNVISF